MSEFLDQFALAKKLAKHIVADENNDLPVFRSIAEIQEAILAVPDAWPKLTDLLSDAICMSGAAEDYVTSDNSRIAAQVAKCFLPLLILEM